jgi:hypothetical protein
MWDKYRKDYGCYWTRNDKTDLYSLGYYDCGGTIVECKNIGKCGDYPNQRAVEYDPCDLGCRSFQFSGGTTPNPGNNPGGNPGGGGGGGSSYSNVVKTNNTLKSGINEASSLLGNGTLKQIVENFMPQKGSGKTSGVYVLLLVILAGLILIAVVMMMRVLRKRNMLKEMGV